jgi:NAD(P)-dependent dehydrogenase (short-subunit alcohol dehydrogenase family)
MSEKPVVMITGASQGLGRELARAFAREGYRLALCARGKEGLERVATALEDIGVPVLTSEADVAVPRDVDRFVALTEMEWGRVDVLVNNASILGPSPIPYLSDFPEQDFLEVLKVNTWGPFLVTKRVMAGMLKRGAGSVIHVTSEAGRVGYAGWGAYGVSKFGLEGLAQSWAAEVDGTGVRVNWVDPGEMDTDMHARAVPDCDYELAHPRDVTDVFLYLASDRSRHVNGMRLEAQTFEGGRG